MARRLRADSPPLVVIRAHHAAAAPRRAVPTPLPSSAPAAISVDAQFITPSSPIAPNPRN